MLEMECRECGTWTDNEDVIGKCKNDENGNYMCPECHGIAIVTEIDEVICSYCGSDDVVISDGINDDEPWVIVTHYKCQKCKAYWYDED